jgi:hypothetical protein
MTRVGFEGADEVLLRVAPRLSRKARGARSSAWPRKAASTSGCPPVVKFMKSGDAGSTACAMPRRARSEKARALPAFGRFVRGQLQPRGEAREQAAEGFELADGVARRSFGLLHRHPGLEGARGEVREHGIGETARHAQPVGPIVPRARGRASASASRWRPGPGRPKRPRPGTPVASSPLSCHGVTSIRNRQLAEPLVLNQTTCSATRSNSARALRRRAGNAGVERERTRRDGWARRRPGSGKCARSRWGRRPGSWPGSSRRVPPRPLFSDRGSHTRGLVFLSRARRPRSRRPP